MQWRNLAVVLLASALVEAGCRNVDGPNKRSLAPNSDMNAAAERYVKLVLGVGTHDPDYVDAYYGPREWREDVNLASPTLENLRVDAISLRARVESIPREGDPVELLRHDYLLRQIAAVEARLDMLEGKKLEFDRESRALYDAVAPHHSRAYFDRRLDELDRALPGSGPLADRLEAFRARFAIPPDRLDAVFQAAITEARKRTAEHIALPVGENFAIEYVTDKPWSGYNWYQGTYRSVIQVNTDLPITIDRAIDLACHEGYPGHHVYNVLLEQSLVRGRGWKEFTVYPLFSPQSLIAEGSANFGIEVAFPGSERLEFEKTVLFPLAGLDPATADRYDAIQNILKKLSYAGNEAARRYLDGQIDAGQAAELLTKYALMAPERAAQRVRFFDRYRSYVINYNLGEDLVRAYVERRGGTADDPDRRWKEFETLLSSPRLPSGLAPV